MGQSFDETDKTDANHQKVIKKANSFADLPDDLDKKAKAQKMLLS